MMAERRSMADALSPVEAAFIKGEDPAVHRSPEPQAVELPPLRDRRERITVTVRLEPDVVAALLQAAAQRKGKRLMPYTQQEIVAEALKQWLQGEGFWPGS